MLALVFSLATALVIGTSAHAEQQSNRMTVREADKALQQIVEKRFKKDFISICEDSGDETVSMQMFELQTKPLYRLYQVKCAGASYNTEFAFYSVTEDKGVQVLNFAEPRVNLYGQVAGMTSVQTLVNPQVNAKTGELKTFAKGRGLGDCFSAAEYVFANGEWLLNKFSVDAECDGEVKASVIVDYSKVKKDY